MLGMATLTIVASIDTISRLRQQDTRMMALRRRSGSAKLGTTDDSFIHTTIVKLQLSRGKPLWPSRHKSVPRTSRRLRVQALSGA